MGYCCLKRNALHVSDEDPPPPRSIDDSENAFDESDNFISRAYKPYIIGSER